jgi:hypothetical protein
MGFFGKKKTKPAPTPGVVARLPGPGAFELDVVGESHYQDALETLCGGRCADGHRKEVEALLIHDDGNQYDDKAVAVSVEGSIVGFLDRKTARNFRAQMAEAGAAGVPAVCQAVIVGGWDRGDDDMGHFGIKLDLPTQPSDDDDEDGDDDEKIDDDDD